MPAILPYCNRYTFWLTHILTLSGVYWAICSMFSAFLVRDSDHPLG